MVGESITVTITQSDEKGVGTYCEIGELNKFELMAAVGTLISDCVKYSDGQLDVENFVAAIRSCYYENL